MLSATWPGWWPWLGNGKGNEKVGNGRKQRRLEVSVMSCSVGEGYEKGWGRDYICRCHKKVLFAAPKQGTQLRKTSACFWLSREQRIAAGKCHPNILAGWPQHTQMQHDYMKQKTPQRPQRRASEMTKMCKWENILEINITFRKGKMHADVIDTFNDIGSSE